MYVYRDSSCLQLYPLLIQQKSPLDYSVMRLGGRTITAISTTRVGATACHLLGKALPLQTVRARLASKFGAGEVELCNLLAALEKANMIYSIDGAPVGAEKPSKARAVLQRSVWWGRRLVSHGEWLLIRTLPLALSYRCLLSVQLLRNRLPRRRMKAQAASNMTHFLGEQLPQKVIQKLSRDHVAEREMYQIDLILLKALPELRVGQWLRRCTELQGKEHLDRALAAGRGVILFTFHMSNAYLLSVVLWLHGYSFDLAGNISWNLRGRQMPFENQELMQKLGNCGKVRWFVNINLSNALHMVRTVNRGGMCIVFPDGNFMRGNNAANYFDHKGALYAAARCAVPFLGGKLLANMGASWIVQQSEALLIPALLERQGRYRFLVKLAPPLSVDRQAPLPQITADLYRVLERQISSTPDKWLYWANVHKFVAES
jgi:lauroyl/myristoyl acyltransferase